LKQRAFLVCLLLICVLWGASCSRNKNPVDPGPQKMDIIKGNVILENQTNHGSCFVWVDSLWIGTVTDSSGYFEIGIPNNLNNINGVFTLYYHIECFKWAGLEIELSEGKLIDGKYDVEKTGLMKTVFLEELARVTLTTDKTIYSSSGDKICYTIHVENLTDDEIWYNTDGFAFYNVTSDTVTVYTCPFYWPAGPPGEFIESGGTYTQEGDLSLPLDQSSFFDISDYYLPDGVVPPGEYFFTMDLTIDYSPYFDIYFKQSKFFTWTSFRYPAGFVDYAGWYPIFNVYDHKDISFPQITIID